MLLSKLRLRNMLQVCNVVFAMFLLLVLLNRSVEVTARRPPADSQEAHDYNGNEGDYNTNTTSGQEQTADVEVESKPEQVADTNQTLPRFRNPSKLHPFFEKPSGNSIVFNCPAVGTPEPTITWLRNGTRIYRQMGRVQRNRWSINMEDLVPDDSDMYTCQICNPVGCIEHSMQLVVSDRENHKPLRINKEDGQRLESENITVCCTCIASNCLGRFLRKAYLRAMNDSLPFEPNVTKIMRGDVIWVMTVVLWLFDIEV